MDEQTNSTTCTIYVRGRIPETWRESFSDLEISVNESLGKVTTRLSGHLTDSAALQGVLNNLYMLGLTLVSVDCHENCLGTDAIEDGHVHE